MEAAAYAPEAVVGLFDRLAAATQQAQRNHEYYLAAGNTFSADQIHALDHACGVLEACFGMEGAVADGAEGATGGSLNRDVVLQQDTGGVVGMRGSVPHNTMLHHGAKEAGDAVAEAKVCSSRPTEPPPPAGGGREGWCYISDACIHCMLFLPPPAVRDDRETAPRHPSPGQR